MPIMIPQETSELPPELMSGRFSPVIGSRPELAAMWMPACTAVIAPQEAMKS